MKISKEREVKIGKFLSYWLRHNPSDINLTMCSNGWVGLEQLIHNSKNKILFDFNDLHQIVKNDDKQRFSFDRNLQMIRANQGHSKKLATKIGLNIDSQVEVIPPTILYHGTKIEFINSIKKDGLKSMKRQYVHLSVDKETAESVVTRSGGDWVILEVEAKKMHTKGHKIYISSNGVYLTHKVKPEYIKFQ